jgi:DNA repair exonuclease SbcCD ATPase subunit
MRSLVVCLFVVFASCLVTPETGLAQSTASRPTSEQSLQELVREVQQLRATLLRINAAMYKGHVMIERLKLQQDQVSRIARELTQNRENVSEIRGQQVKYRELLKRIEAGVEVGMKDSIDLVTVKTELENLSQREQRLSMRETQLSSELEIERAKLNELNDRLNALELELTPGKP